MIKKRKHSSGKDRTSFNQPLFNLAKTLTTFKLSELSSGWKWLTEYDTYLRQNFHVACLSVAVSRLESMWHDELKNRGREGASLTRVFWRFCQTRMLVAIFSLLLTMVAGFVGPVSTDAKSSFSFCIQLIQLICLSTWLLAWSPKYRCIFWKSLYPVSRWSENWNENIQADYKVLDSETHINTID